MRVVRIVLSLCGTALAIVFTVPAYAQTTVNQIPDATTGATVMDALNQQTLSLPGTSEIQILGQVANNTYNIIGPTAYFGEGLAYTINQQTGAPPTGTSLTQHAINTNIVNNQTQPALSTVTAGGFQNAGNAANVANFAPAPGSFGSLTQLVSDASLVAANAMSATVYNGTASVIGSNGAGAGFQKATGSLNTAQVLVDTSTNLSPPGGIGANALEQKMGGPNTVTAINSAIANSTAPAQGGHLDPSVQTLDQSSFVSANQIDFQSVPHTITFTPATSGTPGTPAVTTVTTSTYTATTPVNPTNVTVVTTSTTPGTPGTPGTPAVTALDYTSMTTMNGFQMGGLTPNDANPNASVVGLTATIGNTAAAFTGPTPGLGYNIGTNVAGDGTAMVSGVTQNTVFALNGITGGTGANLTLGAAAPGAWVTQPLPVSINGGVAYTGTSTEGFLQYIDPATVKLVPTNDAYLAAVGLSGVINGIAARVNNGAASIVGAARMSASDPLTQSFTLQLNSINTAGTLSGNATQVALNMTSNALTSPAAGSSNGISYTGYVNLAVASADTSGPASLTNVSQSMNQSLNTLSSGNGVDFNLNQAVTSPVDKTCTLCSNNIQVASAANVATISGAQQFINNSVNVAGLSGISGTSTINQTTSNVTLIGVNQLATLSGFNASISRLPVCDQRGQRYREVSESGAAS